MNKTKFDLLENKKGKPSSHCGYFSCSIQGGKRELEWYEKVRYTWKNRTRFPVDVPFKCGYCDYGSKYSDAEVKTHENNMHQTDLGCQVRNLICEIEEPRAVGQICQICSKCCHSKHELEWHISRFHFLSDFFFKFFFSTRNNGQQKKK